MLGLVVGRNLCKAQDDYVGDLPDIRSALFTLLPIVSILPFSGLRGEGQTEGGTIVILDNTLNWSRHFLSFASGTSYSGEEKLRRASRNFSKYYPMHASAPDNFLFFW